METARVHVRRAVEPARIGQALAVANPVRPSCDAERVEKLQIVTLVGKGGQVGGQVVATVHTCLRPVAAGGAEEKAAVFGCHPASTRGARASRQGSV